MFVCRPSGAVNNTCEMRFLEVLTEMYPCCLVFLDYSGVYYGNGKVMSLCRRPAHKRAARLGAHSARSYGLVLCFMLSVLSTSSLDSRVP
uniref:Secreted protein n=1 Tax=Steinernema glaseri TaxID=37863 RepID=A0A1I8AWP1_9BILA